MAEETQNTQTRTAMVDGEEMDADKAAAIHEVREIFMGLRKCLKQISMYRHNVDRYGEYLEPVHSAMADFLERKGSLQIRVDAMSYKFKRAVVFEDDSRENNIIYPYWSAGIRLFIFKPGLTAEELLRFLMLTITSPEERARRSDDIVTLLWKEEFDCIDYIVVEGFKVLPEDDIEEVEIEVEKVVAYLYRQLQSNSDDYLRFARISLDDLDLQLDDVDQIRGAVIKGVTATAADKLRLQSGLDAEKERVLPKLITVLFQLMELDTREDNFEDVAEAFVQLLDALLFQENFSAIHHIRSRFGMSMKKESLRPEARDLVGRCAERFAARMAEGQRLQTIGSILNQGIVKDADGVRNYLFSLGEDCLPPLVDMLETLELPPNRRLVCDVLAELGENHVPLFTARLNHPSSNLVKDMLYVIDKLDPTEKFAIFAHVLSHPNAILRLETLNIIGRNNNEECFALIRDTLLSHADSQMRSQAARCLPNYEPEEAVPLLMQAAAPDRLDQIEHNEKKAIFTAIGMINSPQTAEFLDNCLNSKAGLFNKKKVDEMKLLAIVGYEAHPSVPSLQKLAGVAKDTKRNSKEVAEVAREAAVHMQQRIMGGR